MEFAEVVLKRRMVRHFSPEPVDPQVISRILELAQHAPSAGYTQGQSFVVVTNPETKKALADLCGEEGYVNMGFHPFVSGASVLIVPCTSEEAYHRRYREPDKMEPGGTEIEWPVPYWHFDIGAASMILLLAVVDEGLAAGFAGTHDLDAVRTLLNLPAEVTPVGVIPIGHRAPDVPSPSLKRGRKKLEQQVYYERWEGSEA
ncbi:MAG TPA: nitroreductase family protein [Chloroflexia bacterium]|jgi:nitroreductase